MFLPILISLLQSPRISVVSNQEPFAIKRDHYGIPEISAQNQAGAFEGQGYSTAQDRMWQMDLSRHLAEGHLASLIGEAGIPSDKAIDATGYTKQEELTQFAALPLGIQNAFVNYAKGVNEYIRDAEKNKNGAQLPVEYTKSGQNPTPWTVYDSVAISIRLFQLFGRGGAGEIRDWALLQYLRSQPKLKGHSLDVFNDIGWINDPQSPTTVSPQDDQSRLPHPKFPIPTNSITRAQINSLPKIGLFELFPAIQMAEKQPSKLIAEKLGVPYRTGSYCVVVSSKRSASGTPILLSAPQMGFTQPSIIHETAIRTPRFNLTGIDVPGMPGIAIGSNGKVTWGITSGVADTEDTYIYPSKNDEYTFEGKTIPLQNVSFSDPVLKGETQTFHQLRTNWGPVAINSKSTSSILVLRSAAWDHELSSLNALFGLFHAQTSKEADAASQLATMSFNIFFADLQGNIGWRFCGKIPIRNPKCDPRLPLWANKQNAWRGFIPQSEMPHTMNPKSGLIYNWNNKPAIWWANGDTPVWGSIFQSSLIGESLPAGKITVQNVEQVPWNIARKDSPYALLSPYLITSNAPNWLKSYRGWNLQGSFSAQGWQELVEAVRKQLFLGSLGNFLGTGFFDEVLQPTVILNALQGRTHFNYLAGRSASQIVNLAVKTLSPPTRFQASGIPVKGRTRILYGDRGSVIMISEIAPDGKWSMRSNLPPGESESGIHAQDQVTLAKQWIYKQTWLRK